MVRDSTINGMQHERNKTQKKIKKNLECMGPHKMLWAISVLFYTSFKWTPRTVNNFKWIWCGIGRLSIENNMFWFYLWRNLHACEALPPHINLHTCDLMWYLLCFCVLFFFSSSFKKPPANIYSHDIAGDLVALYISLHPGAFLNRVDANI